MNINLTLLGQMLAFGCFVWFCMKYVWPPVLEALKERQEKIAEGLNQAEQAKFMLDESKKEREKIIVASKKEANNIIANTQKISQSILEDAKQNAQKEQERIIQAGREQIEQLRQQTVEELRLEFGAVVFQGVEKVLMREVDETTHQNLLEKLKQGIQ